MNNISPLLLSLPSLPKTPDNVLVSKKRRRMKNKGTTNGSSNQQEVAVEVNINEKIKVKQKDVSKLNTEKSKPSTSSQDGATTSNAKKTSKKTKKKEEAVKTCTIQPLMSTVVDKNVVMNNLNNSSKKSVKKTYSYYCSVYKGLVAFNTLKKQGSNIWTPPKKKIMENSYCDNNEIQTDDFNFDIEWVNQSNGRFIRKRSSNKHVNLHTFGPKFPVTFESHSKDQDSDTSMEEIRQELENIDLSSSFMDTSIDSTPNSSKDCSTSNKTPNSERKRNKVKKFLKYQLNKKEIKYPDYMPSEKVEEGLESGSLIKGFIRINQRNPKEAYVSSLIKGDTDYIIKSVLDQNRALEGDQVVLKVKPETEWEGGRKTACVVFISKMMHSRTSVGSLSPLMKNENYAVFTPKDNKFPCILIPMISWPEGFKSNPKSYENNLFLAKITEWTNLDYAKGLILENIGLSGDLKIENLAILKTNCLDHEPFGNDIQEFLPEAGDLREEWLADREDIRNDCVFTIDPLTARDLDDAVSCKTLPDGNLEIGVHIADVTFFLKEGTILDKQVASKATTIYMVNSVYHMLPVQLCMNCSLLPGKDKLTFSVFWIMTPDGEILSTRFAKTVMNSCAQLAYEHAQAIIDDPDCFDRSSIPDILNGYSVDDAKDTILTLFRVSKNLRRKRFENGALRIDQVKLSYELDPRTGYPVRYYVQEIKEANRLIEEFMLLANISVAEKILESFPDKAFLRLHEPPKLNMLVELKRALESVGIHVDISSAKSIQSSLLRYGSDDEAGKIRTAVLNHLFAKPMTRARYFCPALEVSEEAYRHYALNVPLYTHFTSPIRRYADVVVHRLLAASLGLTDGPNLSSLEVGEIAARCNIMKYSAKKAQEESSHLYLCHYIAKNQPFIREAAVVEVRERNFDVLVLECGEVLRIHLHEMEGVLCEVEDITTIDLDVDEKEREIQRKYWRVTLSYPPTRQYPAVMTVIELFTSVRVFLKMCPKTKKLIAKLVRPNS